MPIALALALLSQVIPSTVPDSKTRLAFTDARCQIGRIALGDIPTINHKKSADAYYEDADPLLAACPKLRRFVPAGYPLAHAEAHVRANVHAPSLNQAYVRPAFIYSIGVPVLSADRRKATVQMNYTCTWLCGATFVAQYVRTLGDGVEKVPFA